MKDRRIAFFPVGSFTIEVSSGDD